MELRSSRLTRASSSRLGQKLHDSGKSTTPRLKSNWACGIVDAKISKRLGVQTTGKNAATEEMAPGGTLNKKKAFTPNRTSLGYTSHNVPRSQTDGNVPRSQTDGNSPRVQSRGTNEAPTTETVGPPVRRPTCPPVPSSGHQTKSQTDGNVPRVQSHGTNEAPPTETVVPPVRRPTCPPAPSSGHQTKSTDSQTQSNGRQKKSSRQQRQSQSPPIISASNLTQPSSTEASKSATNTQQSSASATETTDTTNDAIDHLRDETTETTEDGSHESDEIEAISTSEPKRKRGPTMGKGLMKAISGSNGKRLKIEVDPTIGRPKSRIQSAKFSSEVGVVARDVLQIPKKWKDVDVKTALEPAFDHMQIHMELDLDDPGVKQSVIERLKNSSRQQRHRMHKHFKQYANVEEAKKNKPASIADQAHWEILCDYFDSEKFKNQSQANTKNRKQVQSKHTTGRTPFIIIQDEISRKNGQKCGTIELYKSTHQNAQGEWLSTASQNNWELMIESQKKYADDGIDITEDEIMAQVLGPANGYVKGRGYGPKPPGKHNAYLQQQLLEKQAELEVAKTDNAAYKIKVDVLTEKLSNQEEKIAKLMAFMTACGRSGSEEKDDSD